MTRIRLFGAAAVLLAGLLLMPAAEAHGLHHAYPAHPIHAYRGPVYRHGVMPRWLLHDVGFLRWYHFNHIYFGPRVGWKRLHRHYLRDYRFHRRGHHRHGHHGWDAKPHAGYREYRDRRHRRDAPRHRRGR